MKDLCCYGASVKFVVDCRPGATSARGMPAVGCVPSRPRAGAAEWVCVRLVYHALGVVSLQFTGKSNLEAVPMGCMLASFTVRVVHFSLSIR